MSVSDKICTTGAHLSCYALSAEGGRGGDHHRRRMVVVIGAIAITIVAVSVMAVNINTGGCC